MVKELLFWEKYRPTTFEDSVILPRINDIITKGMETNMLFEGPPGCGKTTLANIIASEYNTKEIKASINGGIDVLREEIQDFVDGASLFDTGKKGIKLVYLSEFDRATPQFQDALRDFIEQYHEKVRFLATCNNIVKISPAMLSRFNLVRFAPQNEDEKKKLMIGYLKRCQMICGKEDINIDENDLKRLVKKSCPDFRRILNSLQLVKITGNSNVLSAGQAHNEDLFKLVLEGSDTDVDHAYVMSNFVDTPEEALMALGRPFFSWITDNKPEVNKKKAEMLPIINKYYGWFSTTLDPVVLILGLIQEYRTVLKK